MDLAAKVVNSILSNLQLPATGTIVNYVKSVISGGLIDRLPSINDLDSSLFEDVRNWIEEEFLPYIQDLSLLLGDTADKATIISPEYAERVNEVIASLHVSRAYYISKADETLVTSLENVSRLKAKICEKIANAVATAYDQLLSAAGVEAKSTTTTAASAFQGKTPESFSWTGTVLAVHPQFSVKTVVQAPKEQSGANPLQGKPVKDYLPWVFTAFFGLIAWTSAAKK